MGEAAVHPHRCGSPSSPGCAAAVLALDCVDDVDRRLRQRSKQIAFGKSTVGYYNYTLLVPHHARLACFDDDYPVTPRIQEACSKRMWDAMLKRWRRALHRWDHTTMPLSMILAHNCQPGARVMVPKLEGIHNPYIWG